MPCTAKQGSVMSLLVCCQSPAGPPMMTAWPAGHVTRAGHEQQSPGSTAACRHALHVLAAPMSEMLEPVEPAGASAGPDRSRHGMGGTLPGDCTMPFSLRGRLKRINRMAGMDVLVLVRLPSFAEESYNQPQPLGVCECCCSWTRRRSNELRTPHGAKGALRLLHVPVFPPPATPCRQSHCTSLSGP